MSRLDIYAPVVARRQAIDWSALHITSDSRAPVGMFRPRVPLLERLAAFLRGIGDSFRVVGKGKGL